MPQTHYVRSWVLTNMKYFVLGVVCTLAILYPSTTKELLNSGVDWVHGKVTSIVEKTGENETP